MTRHNDPMTAAEIAARLGHNVHVDGIPWHDAPRPRRWHRCRTQSEFHTADAIWRKCACGGMRNSERGPWVGRNNRSRP